MGAKSDIQRECGFAIHTHKRCQGSTLQCADIEKCDSISVICAARATSKTSTWTHRGVPRQGGHGRRHPDGSAILGLGRAPAPTAPGGTAGSGLQGLEAAGATATAQSRAPAAPRLGSATAAAVVEEAEGGADVEASASAGSVATLAGSAGVSGPAAMLAAGAAGAAAGEQAAGALEATTVAGARAQGSAAGGNGHRAEDAAAATDLGSVCLLLRGEITARV